MVQQEKDLLQSIYGSRLEGTILTFVTGPQNATGAMVSFVTTPLEAGPWIHFHNRSTLIPTSRAMQNPGRFTF